MNLLDTYPSPNNNSIDLFDNLDVAEATRREYKLRFNNFKKYISQYGFTVNSYLGYKKYLASRNELSVSSKNKYLISARIGLKEAYKLGILDRDITNNVKGFRQSKIHKRAGITQAEIKTITTSLKILPSTPRNARLAALIYLLTFQGLRQCEIVRLNVSDINFIAMTAYVRSKGQDDTQNIPLHPQTIKALKTYLKLNHISDGPLLINLSCAGHNERLSTRGLRKVVINFLVQQNIYKSVHGFRHYFVSELVRAYKGDLLEVTRYTRHRSLEMLQVYNDNILLEQDLPRFYQTFNQVIDF